MNQDNAAKIKALALEAEPYVVKMRREFHMYPEISFREERTSARIQEELAGLGIPYEVLPDRSVIGTIEGAEKGKTLAIRADIDALALCEETDAPYKSKTNGVMHACGHDAHGAMLLGIAQILLKMKERLKGTVRLIFQVGEEVGGGYEEILNYFARTGGADRIIATHVWANLDAGTIAADYGARMAGAQAFSIKVTGRGGHGSRPDQSISPIFPLCDIVMKLPYVPQYFHNALETSVVSIGKIEAGTASSNIIPDSAEAKGGMRFFNMETRDSLQRYIDTITENIARAYGAEGRAEYGCWTAPVINDKESVDLGRKIVGEGGVDGLRLESFEQICASDCYGSLLQKYPGCYFFLGIRNEKKGIIHNQHSAKYDIDEDVMRPNCEFMAKYALEYLS